MYVKTSYIFLVKTQQQYLVLAWDYIVMTMPTDLISACITHIIWQLETLDVLFWSCHMQFQKNGGKQTKTSRTILYVTLTTFVKWHSPTSIIRANKSWKNICKKDKHGAVTMHKLFFMKYYIKETTQSDFFCRNTSFPSLFWKYWGKHYCKGKKKHIT